jgi:hypothetical protein
VLPNDLLPSEGLYARFSTRHGEGRFKRLNCALVVAGRGGRLGTPCANTHLSVFAECPVDGRAPNSKRLGDGRWADTFRLSALTCETSTFVLRPL